MQLTAFIRRLHIAIDKLPNDILDTFIESGANALDAISHRITETGKNAKGVSLADIRQYKAKYIRYKQNYPGVRGRKKKSPKEIKTDSDGNQIKGRYRGFVDYTLTGRMWNNIQVLIDQSKVNKEGVKIKIGATSEDDKDKVENNTDLRGDFLDLSEREVSDVADSIQLDLQDKFNSYFK